MRRKMKDKEAKNSEPIAAPALLGVGVAEILIG